MNQQLNVSFIADIPEPIYQALVNYLEVTPGADLSEFIATAVAKLLSQRNP
jgi:hypothetical protein